MSWVLSLLGRHWLKVAALGLALGLFGGVYGAGYNAAWRQAQVDTLKATIASQQRDIDASTIQRKADQDTLRALEQQASDNEAQNDALRKALAERDPNAARGLTQLELDLLLGKRK